MCGIAVIIGGETTDNRLERMLIAQTHRGPDHTGTYTDRGFASLGHNRLAIIDTTAAANQPFKSDDERYILTFNGEIYNYKELRKQLEPHYNFRTESDTEVLLKAFQHWGENCLDKLKGMFAFAIWDTQDKELFVARDRFGVKPLFYAITGDGKLVIASEIKALHAAGIKKSYNERVWANYFAYGSYGSPEETFWKDVKQLRGGYFLRFRESARNSKDNFVIEQWFDFEKLVCSQPKDLDEEQVKQEYSRLLENSIKLRFRADVPIGFNLSGGLDSSTLLYLVNTYYPKEKDNCKAFTFYTGDERYDELSWVKMMLQTTRHELEKVHLTATDVPLLSEQMEYHQDEPYGGIPTIAYGELFRRARQEGVLVLLDGQGMDEQWAGYDYYHTKLDTTIQGVSKSPFREGMLSQNLSECKGKIEIPKVFESSLQQKQYRDLFYTKIPRALRFNDRASMAHSVELREPFLDEELVAFAFAQPARMKYKEGHTKYLLRELAKDKLSKDLTLAPKRPLQTPQREWLSGDLQPFVNHQLEKLLSSELAYFFNTDNVRAEWLKYQNGDRDSSFHIWQLVNTALTL